MDADEILKEQREYAWNYFSLHASQRISLFNFFVVFSSLATTALVATFEKDIQAHWLGIILGLLLICVSSIFYVLDRRVSSLIHHSENVLKHIESLFPQCNGQEEAVFRIFTNEATSTDSAKQNRRCHLLQPLTYHECFRIVLSFFAILGVIGIAASAVMLFIANKPCSPPYS
jgi:hypothetical protein